MKSKQDRSNVFLKLIAHRECRREMMADGTFQKVVLNGVTNSEEKLNGGMGVTRPNTIINAKTRVEVVSQ